MTHREKKALSQLEDFFMEENMTVMEELKIYAFMVETLTNSWIPALTEMIKNGQGGERLNLEQRGE